MINPEGLMPRAKRGEQPTPVLDAIRAELHPEPLTLEEELSAMSEQQRLGLLSTYKMISMMYLKDNERSFEEHVDKLQRRAPAGQKRLYVKMLNEFLGPEAEYQVAEPTAAPQSSSPSYKQQSDFMSKLIQSESSGDTEAEITIADGRKFTGALQFGAARLADFKQATGIRFTQEQFKADP